MLKIVSKDVYNKSGKYIGTVYIKYEDDGCSKSKKKS